MTDPTPQATPLVQKASPLDLLKVVGVTPDPWQKEVLESNAKRILLNCSRQAGKTMVVSALAAYEALTRGGAMIVIISRSARQAAETLRRVAHFARMAAV